MGAQGHDRAFAVEEQFYQDVFAQFLIDTASAVTQPRTKPNLPSSGDGCRPHPRLQAERIAQKRQAVARQLQIAEIDILASLCPGRYRLSRARWRPMTPAPKS
ncbi:hypothetical protein [Escherichia coli]|uniref:hypothetical protein n=1 Tax=Escherichia coli TaxID=562 RepID=UPI002147A0F3|nr:hypothetical protein [Escherichia coli]MCR1084567.1 hypothetical protein [Escherichia coli]